MRVKMAAAEAANCIMEVSIWNAAGEGGRFGGLVFHRSVVGKGLRVGGWELKASSYTEGRPHAPDSGIPFEVRFP